jgi:drug/metabolite transporter (DMT)-like permease
MSSQATLLWLCNLFFDTLGQLSFKAGASTNSELNFFAAWRRMLINPWIWVGVSSFILEFFLWLAFLSLVPLSTGVLVGSLNILTVMLGGRLIFKEQLTPRRILATSLIAIGVILVGWA